MLKHFEFYFCIIALDGFVFGLTLMKILLKIFQILTMYPEPLNGK